MKFLGPMSLTDSWRRAWLTLAATSVATVAVSACTFDPDDRCDPHQIISSGICVCAEGYASTADGCVACGEHEIPGSGGCVCEEGFARSTESSACEPVPVAQGAACDDAAPCADTVFDYCHRDTGESGYCTQLGCATSSDCAGGYACDTSADPSVCLRPPLGLGKTCSSAADCADGEATFCESFQTRTCQVQGCSVTGDDCFVGYTCADLSSYGLPITLCVPEGSL
jgi:hypothetical protein